MPQSMFSFFSAGLDLSALLMLMLYPDSLALRVAIGLFDPLGLALLGGCLSLPLSLRGSTTRAFSGYRAVVCTRSLNIPLTWCLTIQHVICFSRLNGMKVFGEYEFDRAL